MRRSNTTVRGNSIRHMTGTSFSHGCQHIASGQVADDGQGEGGGVAIITRRYGEPVASLSHTLTTTPSSMSLDNGGGENGYANGGANGGESGFENGDPGSKPPGDESEGQEEEAIVFPQSTHSWLFTEHFLSRSFWFALGIVTLSYFCLILALINDFEDLEDIDPGNPFGVPYQVVPEVRMAQYLAIVISLIMEEEIPTGLYLLRMISKESLHKKFPKMKFWRFVAAAVVRLAMGYLFLFNTFLIVAQATAVLDIFYDVLALQFLQQLDDIAFNIAKINVFGRHLKQAALSNCFSAQFEKSPFAHRRKINYCLKVVFVFNLCVMLGGMGWITYYQNRGLFHAEEITVMFGEQIWREALVTLPSGEVVTRALLFSYFNGVYRRQPIEKGDITPIYVEQNKYDGSPYKDIKGAEIKFCKKEKVWAFSHVNIKKNEDETDEGCPWLLRSPETTEFNLLDVTGDWSIWTGSIQPNGRFSAMDNHCDDVVQCNYNGICVEGKCVCSDKYYGAHCEHTKPCSLITADLGGTYVKENWKEEVRIYQRPVYGAKQGIPGAELHRTGVNPVEDQIFLMFTGSRWLGVVYPGAKRLDLPAEYWKNYAKQFHAFWEDTYTNRTKFVSAPTVQSSIIGVDFFGLGRQGEEFGPFGELFPLGNRPPGSGYMKCVENNPPPPEPAYDINYQGITTNFNVDGIDTVVNYEIAKDRDYESNVLGRGCTDPIIGIDLNLTAVKSAKNSTHDSLSLNYHFNYLNSSQISGSNIWNPTNGEVELCQIVRLVFPAVDSIPKMVIIEDKQILSVSAEGGSE